jgi:hypothetical protein
MCCIATALWNFRPALRRCALKLFIKCQLNGCEQIVAKSERRNRSIGGGQGACAIRMKRIRRIFASFETGVPLLRDMI